MTKNLRIVHTVREDNYTKTLGRLHGTLFHGVDARVYNMFIFIPHPWVDDSIVQKNLFTIHHESTGVEDKIHGDPSGVPAGLE